MTMLRGIICPKDRKEAKIKPIRTIGMRQMELILRHKLGEMSDEKAAIYLPDRKMKIYDKEDVKDFLHLDETDKIVYVAEDMDCDDFAAELFGKFAGLVWTNTHALNWFVDDTLILWFIEPQTDKISKNLENWQGWDIRFLLGR